jgi:Short C-terminal domain
MRRRGIGRRGPGLAGTVARTAVIAGTATAVSGSMQKNAAGKQQAAANAAELEQIRQQEQMEQMVAAQVAAQTAAQQPAAPPPPPAPAAAAPAGDDLMSKLKELASLKDAGVLTDDEFAAAKAKLLS